MLRVSSSCNSVFRLAAKASECVKEGVARDAHAHQQLQFELVGGENSGELPANLPAPALAQFLVERTLSPQRPSFPRCLVSPTSKPSSILAISRSP